jgi:hypothetical protein
MEVSRLLFKGVPCFSFGRQSLAAKIQGYDVKSPGCKIGNLFFPDFSRYGPAGYKNQNAISGSGLQVMYFNVSNLEIQIPIRTVFFFGQRKGWKENYEKGEAKRFFYS